MSIPFEPRVYQGEAVGHLLDNERSALWAEMGLGKTCSTLAALDTLRLVDDVFPALVVAPRRVANDVWPGEVAKWDFCSHWRVAPILGNPAQREAALKAKADIYTINPENVAWLSGKIGDVSNWPFKTIIVDEATTLSGFRGAYMNSVNGRLFYRGGGTQWTRALGRFARQSPRIIELTGEPAPNGLCGLWGQMWFIDSGQRLGSTYTAYTERWFIPKLRSNGSIYHKPMPTAQVQIQDALKDVCLTLRADDWLPLEKTLNIRVEVTLPAKARRAYQDIEKRFFTELEEGTVTARNAETKSIKLLQIAVGAVHENEKHWEVVHDEKIEALRRIIEDLNGANLLVMYQWRHDLARLLKAFPGAVALENAAGEAAFKAGDVQIGLGHPDSVGLGVDGLHHHCHHLAVFSHWWDLGARSQMLARVGPVRQYQGGYNRRAVVYDIVAKDTIDEIVMLRHASKRSVQDLLAEATKKRRHS